MFFLKRSNKKQQKNKIKTIEDYWNEAVDPKPQFFQMGEGKLLGAIQLTENTYTVLWKDPVKKFQKEGDNVVEWKLFIESTSKDQMIGELDYFEGIDKLKEYLKDEKEDRILVNDLVLFELEELLQ